MHEEYAIKKRVLLRANEITLVIKKLSIYEIVATNTFTLLKAFSMSKDLKSLTYRMFPECKGS